MFKKSTFLATVTLALLLPQQAGAFITVVQRVSDQEYLFQADNAETALIGQPGGFKVRIATVDFATDPTFARAKAVSNLSDMLRLNLYHPATGARQTTVFTEESPGLYVARFTPTMQGPYTYTVAALLGGFPLSITFTCTDQAGQGADDVIPDELLDEENVGNPLEQLLWEGDIRCPAGSESTLRFPPDTTEDFGQEFTGGEGLGSAQLQDLQATVDNLVVARTILYVITGFNLILSAVFGILLSRAVF